jgi:hypothetical protein
MDFRRAGTLSRPSRKQRSTYFFPVATIAEMGARTKPRLGNPRAHNVTRSMVTG